MVELILLYLKTNKNRALSILYKKYYDKIFSMSRKILKDKNEAEDCVQEVFIKVMENIDKFRFGSSISTWIYRIAINHIINKNKKVEYDLEIDEEKLYDKLKYEIKYTSLDYFYNEDEDFDNVYNKISNFIIEEANKGDLVYVVPGHPRVAEKTVSIISSIAIWGI